MAGGDDPRDDEWGTVTARKTFMWTVISAALFVSAVAIFIFGADRGR